MAQNVFFKKGLLANLPSSYAAGTFYVTTDERAMYLDIDDSTRIRLGDFIQVAAVENLPAEGASTSALYYCVKENILAKYDGSAWTQINKQPTAEEMKTLLGLGAMAYKSTVVEGDLDSNLAKKINDASAANHGHDNKGVLDGITSDKVTAWDNAEKNAKDHADGLNTAMNTRVEALEAIDHEHTNKALLDTYTQTEANIADAVAKKHSHNFSDETALNSITAAKVADWDDAVSKEHTHTFADVDVVDAISKKHSHTFVESELNKIVAGDVAKWNGVVADHLTAADKSAIEDSIGDVNTALENYKTSNNEALAGVKATADAAATKEYTDAELAKKVAKTDYEADKATFATKTELNGVDAKFADYNTKVAQKAIDDAQDAEIAKKVDKVEGKSLIADSEIARLATLANYDDTQVKADIAKKADAEAMTTELGKKVDKVDGKDLIATSEIERLATLKNYDDTALTGRVTTAEGKISALEGASATHATKSEVEAVDAKFADYTKTADLPTDLDDFTNNAGYAKTADVNAELDKKADKTQVATDIANAIAPLATTEALNGVKATAEAAAVATEVEAALALKADKTALEATDKTLADVKATVDNFFAEDAAIEGAIDTLKEIAAYIATDKEGAADITARVGALEGKVDVEKVSTAISTAIAAEVTRADGAYDAKGAAATAKSEAIEDAAGKYETKGTAQGIVDALKLSETYEPVGAETRAIAAAKTETEKQVGDLAKTLYTKDEVDALINAAHQWGEF